MGMPVDYKKELSMAFGDYVESYEGTDNTSRARSSACIALYPTANSTGAWVLWKVESQMRVRRTNYVKLVTSQQLIDAINQIAITEERQNAMPDNTEETRQSAESVEPSLTQDAVQETENILEQTQEESEGDASRETIQEAVQETVEESDIPEEVDEGEIIEEASAETQGARTRSGRLVMKPSRFLAVTKVSAEEWKDVENVKAIKIELRMLFEELKALRPIRRAAIKGGTKILRSHMFLVEKYLADGTFEKIKARLVADGRDQDATMYPDKASPTVSIHSVFTSLGVMMSRPWLIVVKIDVKGAFIQTPMEGEPVYMRVDKKISKHVVEEFPELGKYVEEDGCIYTILQKAMYGCVQASALWYKLLRKVLEGFGYEASETDQCVFRKVSGEKIYILLVYVDDVLALVDAVEAVLLKGTLERHFGTVTFEEGKKLSYLGMQLEVRKVETTVDMCFYVKKILEDVKALPRESPGTKNTFIVESKSTLLGEEDRKMFHKKTAQLLYLAKRARPDVLTVVSFLCTRVQSATVEDQRKLMRVLGYITGTAQQVLVLRATGTPQIRAYVDAAYAIHEDSKSHTGVVVYVGETLVYVSSKKQKCMSKSPTEAELIGLTDNLGLVELFKEFVEFVVGQEVQVPIVYQDCKAVLSLVAMGGGITRTKHLRARMNLGREVVNENRALVQYVKAEDMKADGFSKPLDPSGHGKFMQLLHN
jgi:hypothetical protein